MENVLGIELETFGQWYAAYQIFFALCITVIVTLLIPHSRVKENEEHCKRHILVKKE